MTARSYKVTDVIPRSADGGVMIYTTCAEKASKLAQHGGLEILYDRAGRRYWYPRWAGEFFATLESAGLRDQGSKIYELVGIARKHREVVAAVDTAFQTDGAVAVHALAAQLLTLYKE